MRTAKIRFSLAFLFLSMAAFAVTQTALDEVKAERHPGRRSELALRNADESVDRAREFYRSGDLKRGDEELTLVEQLADECLSSVEEAHKSKYTKKAELRVAALSRRVSSLADDLGYDQRDKAHEVHSRLEEIHDKLLAGVMGK
jgi:hypothetical protein